MHYGDTTLTFLNNWYGADQRGTSLTYASAVAVEEKSVIDYNRGNPDGVLEAGEEPASQGAARRDLPRGGHALLRQPVLRPRRRVGYRRAGRGRRALPRVRAGARQPGEGARFGFRPGNPAVAIGAHRRRERRRPRPAPDAARGARAARCWPGCSTSGRTSASPPGCCSSWTCRGRWATSPTRTPAPPSSTSPSRRRSPPSTSSTTTTRSASGSSRPTSAPTATRT